MESHITLAVDKLCASNDLVIRIWDIVGKEEGRSSVHLVCTDLCIRCVQQGLHFTSTSIAKRFLSSPLLTYGTVLSVVPSASTATHTEIGPVPETNCRVHSDMGGNTGTLAERSLQTRILGSRCLLQLVDEGASLRRWQCLCAGRCHEELQAVIIQAINCCTIIIPSILCYNCPRLGMKSVLVHAESILGLVSQRVLENKSQ